MIDEIAKGFGDNGAFSVAIKGDLAIFVDGGKAAGALAEEVVFALIIEAELGFLGVKILGLDVKVWRAMPLGGVLMANREVGAGKCL